MTQGAAVTRVPCRRCDCRDNATPNIRHHGYGADNKVAGRSGLKEEGAMSVAASARQIINALRGRRRELVMTTKARVGL
jgi:hypothetical protein